MFYPFHFSRPVPKSVADTIIYHTTPTTRKVLTAQTGTSGRHPFIFVNQEPSVIDLDMWVVIDIRERLGVAYGDNPRLLTRKPDLGKLLAVRGLVV